MLPACQLRLRFRRLFSKAARVVSRVQPAQSAAANHASTDDAYIDGHVTAISPQVPALASSTPTDYQVALEQAKAQAVAAAGRRAQAQTQIQATSGGRM